ncbi:hypothetical protein C3L33_06666, partial [Rhododendron williamsianum]
ERVILDQTIFRNEKEDYTANHVDFSESDNAGILLSGFCKTGPVLQKEEATIPVTTLSPPEGNTTFLGGTTWCVALPGVSQVDLQNALDWACGLGNTNCGPIQSDGDCFQPDRFCPTPRYAKCVYTYPDLFNLQLLQLQSINLASVGGKLLVFYCFCT